MQPDVDDSIEIIDVNNNEEEEEEAKSSNKSNGEDSCVQNPCQTKANAQEYYQVDEIHNIKTVKVLLCKNNVAKKLITLDVPFLCQDYEIISAIFPGLQMIVDNAGYKIVGINTEAKIEVSEKRDSDGFLRYTVNLHSEIPRRDKFVPLEDDDDCQVIGKDEVVSPPKRSITSSKCKDSVDSQESYYETAEQRAENQPNVSNDEEFHSCIDAENDINVKENDKNAANLFAIPEKDECDDNYHSNVDVCNKNPKEDEYQHILEDTENKRDTQEIHTSRFYSQTTQKSSSNTIQLSSSSDEHSPVLVEKKSSKTSKSARNTILAVYPLTPGQGRITIYKDNYKCLGDGEFLNDVIIDFYLKYLMNEVLSEEDRNRTYVFSSQFFTRLSKPVSVHTEEEHIMSEAERRYVGVQKWTKHVNIFEKDFVIVPINENAHWNLVIICFPGLVGMMDEDAECLQRPCILFFDSISHLCKEKTIKILRNYLKREYLTKVGGMKSFSNSVLKLKIPLVPKQKNATDCGLYLLQYVEQFFEFPIMDFTASPLNLSQWFERIVVKRKRAEIAKLIADIANSYNSENPATMPSLEFPSDNVSSDEEDLKIYTGKRKNSFPRDTSPSFESTPSKICKSEKSYFPSSFKNKEKVQSFLDDWIDVRNAHSSSDKFQLYSNFDDVEDGLDHNSNGMGDQEKSNLSNTTDVSDSEAEKSVEFSSQFASSNGSSLLKTYKNKHSNVRKISLIKENFSGTKSHMFRKSSIFSTNCESEIRITRPKRERQPKSHEEVLKQLVAKFQAKKIRKEKQRDEERKKASTNWIDESVFISSDSVYTTDDEPGIPPSKSYKQFKREKEFSDGLKRWKL